MANPSPAAIQAIRSKVASGWSAADAAILDGLNAPTIANPTPQPQVRRPLTVAIAMGLVIPENRAKVYARPAVVAFRDDLSGGDLAGALNWLALAKDAGDVTKAEFDAIVLAATATQPDPAWPPQISWAVATLGRPADLEDVAAARRGA